MLEKHAVRYMTGVLLVCCQWADNDFKKLPGATECASLIYLQCNE